MDRPLTPREARAREQGIAKGNDAFVGSFTDALVKTTARDASAFRRDMEAKAKATSNFDNAFRRTAKASLARGGSRPGRPTR